jgi:hypothetical protein
LVLPRPSTRRVQVNGNTVPGTLTASSFTPGYAAGPACHHGVRVLTSDCRWPTDGELPRSSVPFCGYRAPTFPTLAAPSRWPDRTWSPPPPWVVGPHQLPRSTHVQVQVQVHVNQPPCLRFLRLLRTSSSLPVTLAHLALSHVHHYIDSVEQSHCQQ